MTDYDVIVIGAGQAGPGIAAAKAAEGRRVAMIEMEQVGGTCLNHGCKPTKALRASATVAHAARRAAEYGVHTGEVTVDFPAAIGRVHRLIETMRSDLLDWVQGTENLELITGTATLVADRDDSHQPRRHSVQVNGDTLVAAEVYLDIGARASIPPIPGLDSVAYLTEVELLHLEQRPEHLVVVGGGYIGCEFGQMFRRFGSEVTMLVGSSGVAAREDPDVAEMITNLFESEGIALRRARPAEVTATADGVSVRLDDGGTVTGSHLLVSTGRRANSDLLGPDHGLDVDDRGFFRIGPRFETSVPGVWALGDINGHGAWTHTAYQDAQILLAPPRTVTSRVPTYAMFTDPPLGRVGMTSAEAKESGRTVRVAEVPMSKVSRAVLESETVGVLRILVDGDSERFLGATILGLHADDLVQQISLALQADLPYTTVRDALPIHPTMAEYLPSVLGSLTPLD